MKWVAGSIIIVIGLILLGQNMGWLSADTLSQAARFWPLILILIGAAILVRHWRWGWFLVLAVLIGSLGLIYLSLAPNQNVVKSRFTSNQSETTSFSQDLPENVKTMKVEVASGAIEMNIGSSSDKALRGSLESNFSKPKLNWSVSNDQAAAKIELSRPTNNPLVNYRNKLDLKLTDKIPVDLKLDAGASKMNLDFSQLIINGLVVNTGASQLDLKLGKTQNAKILINAGASNLNIGLAKEVGVKLTLKTGLTSKNLGDFTKLEDGVYQSNNYDQAQNKIDMEIKAGASSLNLYRY